MKSWSRVVLLRRMICFFLFAILACSPFVVMRHIRSRHLAEASRLLEKASSLVVSQFDSDWVWHARTNSLEESSKALWTNFLTASHRILVFERKSVQYKDFSFLESDGSELFSVCSMKWPLFIVRIGDKAYEFEACDWMFNDAGPFKGDNKIVSSFKSDASESD